MRSFKVGKKKTLKKQKEGIEKKKKPLLKIDVREPDNASFFRMYLYETKKDAENGANRYLKKHFNASNEDLSCVVLEAPRDKNKDWFSSLFINLEDLEYSLLAHECLHLAINNENKVVKFTGNYSTYVDDGNSPEERLCYKMQTYLSVIINACKNKGIRIIEN
jgi:hypothetical protein